MAWIRILGPDDPGKADGGTDPVLEDLRAQSVDPASGEVDEILAVHSLHPEGWKAHLALYRAAMRGTRGLPRVDRELIALFVSRENGCHY